MPIKINAHEICNVCGGKYFLSNKSNHLRTKKCKIASFILSKGDPYLMDEFKKIMQ